MTFAVYIESIPNINIHKYPVNIVEYYKYLGIQLECHLRWNMHIQRLTNKITNLIFIIPKPLKLYTASFNYLCSYSQYI